MSDRHALGLSRTFILVTFTRKIPRGDSQRPGKVVFKKTEGPDVEGLFAKTKASQRIEVCISGFFFDSLIKRVGSRASIKAILDWGPSYHLL